jgi:putative ABC transport system ATP-binding protein
VEKLVQNTIVEANDITKIYYRGRQQIKAVDAVSVSIPKGAFFVIEGVSGSGKSTLLQVLGALDLPTSGKLEVDGVDLTKARKGQLTKLRRNHIGFVFQSFNLIPTLTALGNVEAALVGSVFSGKKRRERAAELLEKMGLGDRLKHLPGKLSGGEQQRVAIARALANNPDLILADEPTGDLDVTSGNQIMLLLKKLTKNDNRTLVVVTHDSSIREFATMKGQMKDGSLEVN